MFLLRMQNNGMIRIDNVAPGARLSRLALLPGLSHGQTVTLTVFILQLFWAPDSTDRSNSEL